MNTRSSYEILDEVGRPADLFPPVFRWVGGGVVVLGVGLFFTLVPLGAKTLGIYLGSTITLVGLALAAYSRERTEDELTRKLRLESALWATVAGVMVPVVGDTLAFLFEGAPSFYTGSTVMSVVLCFYLVRFHSVLYSLRSNDPDDA